MLKDLSDHVKIFGSSQSVKPICPDSPSLNEIVLKRFPALANVKRFS
jgi:hypothetical protein